MSKKLESKLLEVIREGIRDGFRLAFSGIKTDFPAQTLDEFYEINEVSREAKYNDKVPEYLKGQLLGIGDNPKALFLSLMTGEKYIQSKVGKDYYFNFSKTELICTSTNFILGLKICKKGNGDCKEFDLYREFGYARQWRLHP